MYLISKYLHLLIEWEKREIFFRRIARGLAFFEKWSDRKLQCVSSEDFICVFETRKAFIAVNSTSRIRNGVR